MGTALASTRYAVFIDARVPDLQVLIDGILPDQAVYVLPHDCDGVRRIADVLAARGLEGLSALHLVAHGAPGRLQLGASWLGATSLVEHALDLARIGSALVPGGDLLLHACEVAAGTAGHRFLNALSAQTGVTVAASTRLVGAAEQGGGWDLDASTSPIAAASPFKPETLASYSGTLAVNSAPSFAVGDGKVITSIGLSDDYGSEVFVQPDGKIVVAGSSFNGVNSDVAVVRYNTDGTLDNSFGSGGKLTTPVGSSYDYGRDVFVNSNGNIIVAGTSLNNSTSTIAIVQYDPNGALDASFGGGDGIIIALVGSASEGNSISVQPDGKIVVAGYGVIGGSGDFAVVRYNTDGTPDSAFGGGDGVITTSVGSLSDVGRSVTIQSDGKILVAGSTALSVFPTRTDFALVRYTADGTPDNAFGGGDGIVVTPLGPASDDGNSVTVQPDGKILVAGYVGGGTSNFALVRYNADGTLDTSFGDGDGIVTTLVGTGSSSGSSVTLQPNGKILVAGTGFGANPDFALVRYNADGTLDTSFGDRDGIVTTPIGSTSDNGSSVTVQSDGKILVAGTSYGTNADFALVRYNADGTLDTSFDPINTLGGSVAYNENGAAVRLDSDVNIVDVELDALNGGLGDYAGATLTLARQGGANAQDVFGFASSTSFSVSGTTLVNGSGQTFATFTSTGGALTVTFTGTDVATSALADTVAHSVTYANSSDTPPSSVPVAWTFSDGNAGAQGTGGPKGTTGTTTVTITAVNDAPVVHANTGATVVEGGTVTATAAMLDYDDAEQADGAITYTITSAATNGTLQKTVNGTTTTLVNGSTFTQADLNNGLISYTHNGGETTSASFGFSVSDGQPGGTVTGKSFSLTVNASNDAPVLTPANQLLTSTNEDTTSTGRSVSSFLSSIYSDADGPLAGVAVTGITGNGTWQYSLDGGSNYQDVGLVSDTTALLLPSSSSTLLRYVPDSRDAETPTLTFRGWDGSTGSASSRVDTSSHGGSTAFSSQTSQVHITVSAVNDAPVLKLRAPNRTARFGASSVGWAWLDLCFPTISGARLLRSCRPLGPVQRAGGRRSATGLL